MIAVCINKQIIQRYNEEQYSLYGAHPLPYALLIYFFSVTIWTTMQGATWNMKDDVQSERAGMNVPLVWHQERTLTRTSCQVHNDTEQTHDTTSMPCSLDLSVSTSTNIFPNPRLHTHLNQTVLPKKSTGSTASSPTKRLRISTKNMKTKSSPFTKLWRMSLRPFQELHPTTQHTSLHIPTIHKHPLPLKTRLAQYWHTDKNHIILHTGRERLFVGCLMSQQHVSVSRGQICSDNCTCCHTEIEVADQTFYLTQSQYTDTRPISHNADPIMPGAWQGSRWITNFSVTGMTRPKKRSTPKMGIDPRSDACEADPLSTRPSRRSRKREGRKTGHCITKARSDGKCLTKYTNPESYL